MFDGLNQQITINLNFANLVIAGVIVAIILTTILLYIWRLNKKVSLLSPKYGFAGKKIVAIALVAFLTGALPFTALIALRSTEIRHQAADVNKVIIETQFIEKTENGAVIGFSIVPFENGIAWWQENYEALWEIRGADNFTFLEQNLNKSNPSYFVRELPAGEYELSVNVTADNFSISESKEFSIGD